MFQRLRKDSGMGKRIQGLVSVKRLDDDLVLSQHFRDW